MKALSEKFLGGFLRFCSNPRTSMKDTFLKSGSCFLDLAQPHQVSELPSNLFLWILSPMLLVTCLLTKQRSNKALGSSHALPWAAKGNSCCDPDTAKDDLQLTHLWIGDEMKALSLDQGRQYYQVMLVPWLSTNQKSPMYIFQLGFVWRNTRKTKNLFCCETRKVS